MSFRHYAVGGCVRDTLLGIAPKDYDYVVLGETPETMLSRGFQQVGAQFPVFLHPISGCEYALARTEKKSGNGYHGFVCDFNPSISLEDDLFRRDLTINSMAMDVETNTIFDPFGGKLDLDNRILRHVSVHFKDDPVRALRLARFAARYEHLGFTIHESTKQMVKDMINNGELDHLVPERIWEEFKKAFTVNFSGFVRHLFDLGILQIILPEVSDLFGVPQTEKYHPEVDTFKHVILCLEQAEKLSNNDGEILWAVMLHDLGKGVTPKDILPSHLHHEMNGLPLVKNVCERFKVPTEYKDIAMMVCQYHLDSHTVLNFKASTLVKRFRQYDAYRRTDRFYKFLICCEADARGRTGFEEREYNQANYFKQTFEIASSVKFQHLANHNQIAPQHIQQRMDELRAKRIHESEVFKQRATFKETTNVQ